MKTSLKSEIMCIGLVLLPFIYLAIVWTGLPDVVPIHWNASGEVDGWGTKTVLILIPFILPFLVYLLFLLLQRFGPAEKLNKMGKKFAALKFILTLAMSLLAVFIIYSANHGEVARPTFIFVLLGLLFAALGNFSKTIQPNYFLGIRTPWTLKHPSVWKSTHELGGKMWFIGGLIIALTALISTSLIAIICMISILVIITIVPVVHSYLAAKKLKTSQS
ncbi:MAG: DUF1648 domain-containing protein [Crocinitomix sp.]|nr:DUF1648 domain-containing protein [Crocinitomix sp.]